MKILKKGTQAVDREKPWWYGMECTCPACNAVLQIEQGDEIVITKPDRLTGEIGAVGFSCPECNSTVRVLRPKIPATVTYLVCGKGSDSP